MTMLFHWSLGYLGYDLAKFLGRLLTRFFNIRHTDYSYNLAGGAPPKLVTKFIPLSPFDD